MTAGRYGTARLWCKISSAGSWPIDPDAFPKPSLPFSCPYRLMTSAHADVRFWCPDRCQAATNRGSLRFSPGVSIAQDPWADLLASAIARIIRGLRSNFAWNQVPGTVPYWFAQRITNIAPIMSSRRISRCPISEIPPSTCLLPVECCRGTSPSQAEKPRLRLNTDRALLHKSPDCRSSPFPGWTYPAAVVTGMPSAVKPFRTAARAWNSAT